MRGSASPPSSAFEPRDHLELAGRDDRHGPRARLSGARFAYLKGDLVMLELALVRWALEKLRGAWLRAGDPAGARARARAVRDRLPARHRAADLPRCPTTSSTSSAPPRSRSPRCTTARSSRRSGCRCATPASRRASAARRAPPAGTRAGIFRVHQFDKVEMFSFVAPEESGAEHERILAIEEEILGELELPYRVVNIAVGDLGNSAAKKYDCEAWLPSQDRYRELTSCSNTTDYQARRLDIRVRARAAARRRRTRSTAPRSRSGARSSRCSRTASARTAPSRCRPRSSRSARRRGSPPARALADREHERARRAVHGRERQPVDPGCEHRAAAETAAVVAAGRGEGQRVMQRRPSVVAV